MTDGTFFCKDYVNYTVTCDLDDGDAHSRYYNESDTSHAECKIVAIVTHTSSLNDKVLA